MTICLATTHYAPQPGGIAHYYTCLTRLLSEAGHSVILLTISEDGKETLDTKSSEGLLTRVRLATDYHRYKMLYSGYFRPGSYGAAYWLATGMAMRDWLIRHASEYQIDLIETMDFGGAGIFLKQAGLPPLIIDAHSSALQISKETPMVEDDHLAVIKQLENLAFTHADAIIAHSPMNLENLKNMGYSKTVFRRAPWLPSRESLISRNPTNNVYLVISSLQLIKGAELMIQAVQKAAEKEPGIYIYWAGEDSYSAPGGTLTSAYLSKKYPDIWSTHFRWLGHKNKPELNNLLAEVAAVIIPSVWDTFNYVVPETVMAGVPLIISDKTGAGYLVSNHPQVRIFKGDNCEELAGMLVKQDLFPPLYRVDEQQKKLEEYFSAANILQERELTYKKVIEEKGVPDMPRINEELKFLCRYLKPRRKIYYTIRKKIKHFIRQF